MNSTLQSVLALAIVAACAAWLLMRFLARRKQGGCSGDCGCASQELKQLSKTRHHS